MSGHASKSKPSTSDSSTPSDWLVSLHRLSEHRRASLQEIHIARLEASCLHTSEPVPDRTDTSVIFRHLETGGRGTS